MRLAGAARTLSLVLVITTVVTGCRSRTWYFQRANQDAQCLLQQKTTAKPWAVPAGFTLTPSPESRLAPLDCLVSPRLPCPTPQLYAYRLPELRSKLFSDESELDAGSSSVGADAPRGVAIPPNAWESLPRQCLRRMAEFDSIQDEAGYSGEIYPGFEAFASGASSTADRLTLEDVVDIALLNSREYQTQKESLFLVSLALSQERFAYANKFSNFGNGTDLGFTHNRALGITENNLSIPSGVAGDKLLVTGGDVLASFANNILLTFNGPSGFAADVSSNILIDFTQPLLQRDIRFEGLTQAERNVVYAARNFARFRKQFFVDFASSYYRLILSFRQIEIESQNYFSLVRAFNQAEAEFGAGSVPRVQVDQVEQNLLNARGSLIGTCNGVEQSLDSLKISMGIPTETPLNLDLNELNELTRLDQLSVSSDLTNRMLRTLKSVMKQPDRGELASKAATLIDRISEAASLTEGIEAEKIAGLRLARARFLLDEERIGSQKELATLENEINSEKPRASTIFRRSIAHANSQQGVVTRQLELAEAQKVTPELVGFAERQLALAEQTASLNTKFNEVLRDKNLRLNREIQTLVKSSDDVRAAFDALIAEIDDYLGIQVESDPELDLKRLLGEAESLVESVTQTLSTPQYGLKPIDIDPDDAMLTALVLRFDLMTQREQAVDDWRQIKLAADNLKSILDLSARQVLRTDPTTNQPFNFSFEDSTTQLGVRFDAPLNRFAQRNTFRATLITYQRALRNLMQLEDSIKFSVRNDLRNLALDREQYLIAVASAALAYERVVSTSLAFRLGSGGVSARDFLEAQTAYVNALSSVASRHINYILDRTQLFLDLELLTVDETGFWQDLRNEEVTPEPTYGLPDWAFPVYGKIPCVMYSREMRYLMEQQPICSGIYLPADSGSDSGTNSDSESDLRTVDPPAPSIIVPESDSRIKAAEEIAPSRETMESPESASLPMTPARPMQFGGT